MLSIYRRYIRFFIGDLAMIEEYRAEIERIGETEDVSDFWVDTIEFELEISGLKFAEKIFDRAILATLKKDFSGHSFGKEIVEICRGFNAQRILYCNYFGRNGKKEVQKFKNAVQKWKEMVTKKFAYCKKDAAIKRTVENDVPAALCSPTPETKFDPRTVKKQFFSLPTSFIYQILKSAKPEILSKLFKSCKSLFKLHSTPLCYQLGVNDEMNPQYFQQSLFIPVSAINFPGLQKLHIVNSLDWIVESDRKALSKVIPKLYRCDAKFIHIDSQDLSIDEFKFITANMQILHMCKTNVFNSDGRALSKTEIVALTSGIVRFETVHW
uniref:F-box domain-containing protein n=1 Tax=Panagrolaimus sp. ES5 TaxID=591445 RepID=A0AC34F3C2_9BILA